MRRSIVNLRRAAKCLNACGFQLNWRRLVKVEETASLETRNGVCQPSRAKLLTANVWKPRRIRREAMIAEFGGSWRRRIEPSIRFPYTRFPACAFSWPPLRRAPVRAAKRRGSLARNEGRRPTATDRAANRSFLRSGREPTAPCPSRHNRRFARTLTESLRADEVDSACGRPEMSRWRSTDRTAPRSAAGSPAASATARDATAIGAA